MTRMTLEIYDALRIAVEELRAQNSMFAEQYRLTASTVAREWVFWFVFLPETFGRDVTVFVNEEKQTRILAGI